MRALLILSLLVAPAFAEEKVSPPAPVALDQAVAKMTLPKGFRATLCAGEPDVVQPMSLTTDDRGRVWVVECMSYPNWDKAETPQGKGKDRVLIFEDTDGDGKFDKRTVFFSGGRNLTSIELDRNGVWLISLPQLLFIPDANGDDKPDGPPVVKLDGFSLTAKHNVANNLTWAPDGWLWGLHGILGTCTLGKPGTEKKDRVAINCGVWRYHPALEKVEVVCHGTTNPWGLDFDQYGEAFITNCVIQHVFHVIPGAHYKRMHGTDFNKFTYDLIDGCADHLNWVGKKWTDSRGGKGETDKAGGGHAHAGCLVYQADQWPAEFRGRLLTCNIHGKRINSEKLEEKGSGYVAKKAPDFLKANDEWFRGLCLKPAPDGGVYVIDWSDAGECHDVKHTDRKTGRIYKITYGDPKPVDMQAEFKKAMDAGVIGAAKRVRDLSQDALCRLQFHPNAWFARQARIHLRGRKIEQEALQLLDQPGDKKLTANVKLRLFWCMALDPKGLAPGLLRRMMTDAHPAVRAWGVRLACHKDYSIPLPKEDPDDPVKYDAPHATIMAEMLKLARNDRSARVRLALASVLQRLPKSKQFPIARRLVSRDVDKDDKNIPLMLWYGIEKMVGDDFLTSTKLLKEARIPLIRKHIARRAAEALD